MAVSLTESAAVFKERCTVAGLTPETVQILEGKSVNTFSKLAFACGQPGEPPDDASLKALVQEGGQDVPISTMSGLRRLVLESQTLMIQHVKGLVENKTEEKTELASAERAARVAAQVALRTTSDSLSLRPPVRVRALTNL